MGHYFTKTNKTLSLIISFLVLLTFSLQAQWESHSVNGLHGKFKQRAGITFKKYGDTYYAFTGDGLFTSSNMVDWNCLTCATDTSKCSDIVITSTNDTLISWKGHVHKKNGSSWDSVANIGGEL